MGCANPIVAEEALVSGWWPSGLGEEAAVPLLASASGDRNGEAGLYSMRSLPVVVIGEETENVFEISAVGDQQPVEAPSAPGAEEALGDGVGRSAL